jgi:hypothetical protein
LRADYQPVTSPDLELAWQAAADAILQTPHRDPARARQTIPEQYLILVTCRDEKEQVELLGRFKREGVECKALLT